jgi:hypothetical protein
MNLLVSSGTRYVHSMAPASGATGSVARRSSPTVFLLALVVRRKAYRDTAMPVLAMLAQMRALPGIPG